MEHGCETNSGVEIESQHIVDNVHPIVCAHGDADIATLLIDNGAVVNFQNKVNNMTLIAEILTVYLYSVALQLRHQNEEITSLQTFSWDVVGLVSPRLKTCL